jgi:hypothetical protein
MAMGFAGDERTTRRVAEAKDAYTASPKSGKRRHANVTLL